MKRLVLMAVAVLISGVAMAQQVRVDVNPDIVIEPNVKVDIQKELRAALRRDVKVNVDVSQVVETALNSLNLNFDDNDDDDRGSRYQQDTQEIEIPLTNPGERGKLNVESHNGRVRIEAYEGQTVRVKMVKYGRKVKADDSRGGMRRISSGGFSVEAQEYRNNVKIENEGWNNRVDFEIQVPKNFDIKAETYNNGQIFIEGVEGELNVESYNGPITLSNINGSASASTYNGAVKVSFTGVTPDTPMAFSTYNGDVDLSLPAGTKITGKMKTNRDIYTDFEKFDLSEPKPTRSNNRRGNYSIKFENWVEGNINGGGPEVMMRTTNGNIYIRKNG